MQHLIELKFTNQNIEQRRRSNSYNRYQSVENEQTNGEYADKEMLISTINN